MAKAWNRKTTEQVVLEIKEKFPNYDCSKVEYVSSKTPIILICPLHGEFCKRPTYGYECLSCSLDRRTKAQTFTVGEFIERSIEVHGEKYDYSLVDYKTARVKVKITCRTHGTVFEQAPYIHMKGKGCKLCANDKQSANRKADKDHFIKRSVLQHGDKFTYERVNYVNAKTPVVVTCKVHGDFPTYPGNHWLGSGCPDCSEYGFSSNRSALLYVMQCEDLIKIGITNSQIIKRNKAINKSYGKTFEVVKYFEHENGLFISNLETEILREMKEQYKQPNNKFGGYSECFFDVDMALLLNNIEDKIKEFNIV